MLKVEPCKMGWFQINSKFMINLSREYNFEVATLSKASTILKEHSFIKHNLSSCLVVIVKMFFSLAFQSS